MSLIATAMILFSILVPSKTWYAPNQAIDIQVKTETPVTLVLRSFTGKAFEIPASAQIATAATVDLRTVYPQATQPGTYVLLAVPKDKPITEFVGTPLLIQARTTPKFSTNIGTNCIRIAPLTYIAMETDKGVIKAAFWFDLAPNTTTSFVDLAQGGYFDGTTFHRIVPNFVIQGGDPTGTGFGGPGYAVDAEFNDRNHEEGVLSMARTGDPLEGKGIPPRPDFANSAGSQFFICLSKEKTQALDRKYTGFGKVFSGWDVVKAIAATEIDDGSTGHPKKAPIINKITVVPVTAADNPYAESLKLNPAADTTQPAAVAPATTAP